MPSASSSATVGHGGGDRELAPENARWNSKSLRVLNGSMTPPPSIEIDEIRERAQCWTQLGAGLNGSVSIDKEVRREIDEARRLVDVCSQAASARAQASVTRAAVAEYFRKYPPGPEVSLDDPRDDEEV